MRYHAIENSLYINNRVNFKIQNSFKKNKIKLYASGGMVFEDQNNETLINEMLKIKNQKFSGWKFRPPSPRNFKRK